MEQDVIRVDSLGFDIDNAQILNNISLSIYRNEFVGLIGPNGCGKSTLLKNIYRHYSPTKGGVYLDGENVYGLKSREVARKMAVVAQENNPDFDFTVEEMIMMGRYPHKKLFEADNDRDRRICDEALELVGLSPLKKRSFLSLSGGEKQRIYLAMAFAQESRMIVLDEPTNHLDIGYQLYMMETMKNFKGKTIFTSVHDMNLAAWFCDRIILMNHGKIVMQGTPEEVLTVENILEVFHVNASIDKRASDGRLNISYISYAGE